MKKSSISFTLLSLLCVMLTSCVSLGKTYESEYLPEYLIRAKSDNGFVSAYQAYFAIDGNSVTEISKSKYEALVLGENSKYEAVSVKTYSFDIIAVDNAPSEWKYTQNEYETERYDVQTLVRDLEEMKVPYTGSLYVFITVFNGYRIVAVTNLDGNIVLDESYAVFRNGWQLHLPKDIRLSQLRDFMRITAYE